MRVKKRKSKVKKLGKGLSSLLVKDEELASIVKKQGRPKKIEPGEYKKNIKKFSFVPNDSSTQKSIRTHLLVPGKFQPRKNFNSEEIEELSESIIQNGILQPILVRPMNSTKGSSYEIIAGERRWRAAQIAKLHEVPVIVRNFDDETSLGVALVENLQRTDLNIIEEAEGYRLLMNKFEYTQEKLSKHIGKSRSHIANLLRLLSLSSNIKKQLIMKKISYGHVRAVLTIDNDSANDVINEIIKKGLSVRQTENIVRKIKKSNIFNPQNGKVSLEEDPNIIALEASLTGILGLKVKINQSSKNKGCLSIFYNNLDQIEPIIDKLRWKPK
ncbi:MAG: ParB/RepB/Spo0J family partition protein [Rickettsiales bacterium TMED254]|nr:chromosome partitioning protein ParB [Rickettsiales bacterium]RPF76605.1 MAG: ParB/RepB/Spo0J family partition protein [Rickettsiales bacterium TMED254]|tara:strand:- start:428 stop:1411 length:984 start_codon:yes stop_codon:yes gene_type:complete